MARIGAGRRAFFATHVVTANRVGVPLNQVLADVVVIDESVLRDGAGRSIEELLREHAGVQLSRTGPPGQSAGVFIRGASMSNVVVLIDGVRVGSATLGQAALESLGLGAIERFEVLRGPGSALYGADAVGGVIHIFTRRGGDAAPRAQAALHVGGYGSSEASVGLSRRFGTVDAARTLAREASDSVCGVGRGVRAAPFLGRRARGGGMSAADRVPRAGVPVGRCDFVTGGVRSGKSGYAQSLAHDAQAEGFAVFVLATALPADAEMRERIARHRAQRPAAWPTVEVPVTAGAPAAAIDAHASPRACLLIDCLTVWLSQLVCPPPGTAPAADAQARLRCLAARAGARAGPRDRRQQRDRSGRGAARCRVAPRGRCGRPPAPASRCAGPQRDTHGRRAAVAREAMTKRLLAVCIFAAAAAQAAEFIDDSGRVHVFASPPQRVATLAPNLTELVFAAGPGTRIVATVQGSHHPPAARAIESVGDYQRVDVERLVQLRPQAVRVWSSGNSQRELAQLAAAGVPVLHLEPRRLADVPRSIERLGAPFGTADEAARQAQQLRAALAALGSEHRGKAPVAVFYQVWSRPLLTLNDEHLISDVIALCGGRNVFGGMGTLVSEVSTESVLAARPEAILAARESRAGDAPRAQRDPAFAPLRAWQAFRQTLPAARHYWMFTLPGDEISRQGPRIAEGARALCIALGEVRRERERGHAH